MGSVGVERERDMRDERLVHLILANQGKKCRVDVPHGRIVHAATDSQIVDTGFTCLLRKLG